MKNTKKFNVLGIKPSGQHTYLMTIEAKTNGYWPINDWIVTNTVNGTEISIYGRNPDIDDVNDLCDDYIIYIEYLYDLTSKFQQARL